MNTAKTLSDNRSREVGAEDLEGFYGAEGALKLWDDKAAWQLRAAYEGSFYKDILRQDGAKRVIDIAAASGFHAIALSQAGFSVTATDGLAAFVQAGILNQIETKTNFPFLHLPWSALTPQTFGETPFDAALCLGGSLHHTNQAGVLEMFSNISSILRRGGLFVVEQRNYEKLFAERPKTMTHPCGWTYNLTFVEPYTIGFHLVDTKRSLDVRCECIATFERELLLIAKRAGFGIKATFFDHGKTHERTNASWIEFIFEAN